MAGQCTVDAFCGEEPRIRVTALLIVLTLLAACSEPVIPRELMASLSVPEDRSPIRVLVVTTTHGYRHKSAINTAKALFPQLEKASEFDFTVTESLEDLENIDRYDVLFFANSTLRLAPETEDGLTSSHQTAILDFIRNGGGFVGAHSALDACYGWDAYRELVGGGLFHSHPWTQRVRIDNEALEHPLSAHLGKSFELKDEIYLLDANPRPTSQVLLSLDATSVDLAALPAEITRTDIPISWTRSMGDGRIFMTKLGHFPEVWLDPAFLEHLLQGLRFAAGRLTQDNQRGTDP